MSAIGIQFAVSIALGALLGSWLDSRFESGPWLLLVGVVLGGTAAFIDLIRLGQEVKRFNAMEQNEEQPS